MVDTPAKVSERVCDVIDARVTPSGETGGPLWPPSPVGNDEIAKTPCCAR